MSNTNEPQTEIERLERQIVLMENTDTLGVAGMHELGELKRMLRALKAEAIEAETTEPVKEKGAIILSQRGKFVSVTFIKRDGKPCRMRVQPATLKQHVEGEAATEAGQKAAETRRKHHPRLMPVWDIDAKAIRSVNLETVTRIAAGGQVHEYVA
ncbi:MAG: hypothetical protein AAFN04_13995 [Pseudomonadota bacterium]